MELTVYILLCADGSYYVGSTKQEIEARVWEHNEGVYDGYTKSRRPVTLVFTETYDRLTDGHARERQIKGWSRARSSLPLVGRGRGGGGPAHIRCGKGCIGGGALFGTVMGCAPPPLSPPHKGEGDALRLLCLNPTQVPHPEGPKDGRDLWLAPEALLGASRRTHPAAQSRPHSLDFQ